jgi:hypothetical protein
LHALKGGVDISDLDLLPKDLLVLPFLFGPHGKVAQTTRRSWLLLHRLVPSRQAQPLQLSFV